MPSTYEAQVVEPNSSPQTLAFSVLLRRAGGSLVVVGKDLELERVGAPSCSPPSPVSGWWLVMAMNLGLGFVQA